MRLPQRPIPAKAASVRVNLIKTLLQVAFMWGTFLWLLPQAIHWADSRLNLPTFDCPNWIGWTVFALASCVGLPCGILFALYGDGTPLPLDTANRLVIRGPYRFIRNPMATMGILQGIGVGLILESYAVIAYSLLGALAWHWIARPWEEADLELRFGTAYQEYRESVPVWLPRLSPYHPRQTEPNPDSAEPSGHAIQHDEIPT